MEEIAALRCASFAMTIERKARSIWQFAKTANCGHEMKLWVSYFLSSSLAVWTHSQ
jgi:hypothetical protein